jgi:hypothetical protein
MDFLMILRVNRIISSKSVNQFIFVMDMSYFACDTDKIIKILFRRALDTVTRTQPTLNSTFRTVDNIPISEG